MECVILTLGKDAVATADLLLIRRMRVKGVRHTPLSLDFLPRRQPGGIFKS